MGRKGVEIGENVAKTARDAAETLSKSAESLSHNPAYKTVAEVNLCLFFRLFFFLQVFLFQGMKTMKKEIDEVTLWDARLYKKPGKN